MNCLFHRPADLKKCYRAKVSDIQRGARMERQTSMARLLLLSRIQIQTATIRAKRF